jgi:hypothetical protein
MYNFSIFATKWIVIAMVSLIISIGGFVQNACAKKQASTQQFPL